jgi:hypothetical protein
MENSNEQREHKIVGVVVNNNDNTKVTLTETQNITFKYDKWNNGKSVAITLSNGLIDAPNIDIYIEHKELIGLLRFLLDEQKQTKITIERLIDHIVVVTSSPNASHVEIQKELTEAIMKSIKDYENI